MPTENRNPTSHLEHEKLKELKEERVALKKGRGYLFPFFLEDARERRHISSLLHSLDGMEQDGFF
jgi:hypothetical protein